MRFSIIIPTFNRADLIGQSIDSALAQTHAPAEVIVVDDGSSDDTRGAVEKYGERVRYVRQENGGKASALNNGVANSTGEVLVVLDDDDIFPKTTLAEHAQALAADPAAAFSFGRYARFEGDKPPTADTPLIYETYPTRDPRRLVVKLMEHCFLSNPAWAVRRQAQLEVGPYNTDLHRSQDFEMMLRMSRAHRGVFLDSTIFLQRTHSGWRGPMSDRTFGVHTTDKWVKYNRMIFEGIDQTWSLQDFAPFETDAGETQDEALLYLQKGVIMFLRKHYPGAEAALKEYRRLLGARRPTQTELRIASGLMGGDYGVAELLEPGAQRDAAIATLRGVAWPLRLRMAFAQQLRWRLRSALSEQEHDKVRALMRFSAEAFGGATALTAMCAKVDGKVGLWRGDTPATGLPAPDALAAAG
ncbi:MAG: glycosyltransferase family 2 protein [Hyphomonadaceae bacterium]